MQILVSVLGSRVVNSTVKQESCEPSRSDRFVVEGYSGGAIISRIGDCFLDKLCSGGKGVLRFQMNRNVDFEIEPRRMTASSFFFFFF